MTKTGASQGPIPHFATAQICFHLIVSREADSKDLKKVKYTFNDPTERLSSQLLFPGTGEGCEKGSPYRIIEGAPRSLH